MGRDARFLQQYVEMLGEREVLLLGSVSVLLVHLPARAGPPAAVRSGRADRGRRSSSRSPARCEHLGVGRDRLLRAARPDARERASGPTTGRRGRRWRRSTATGRASLGVSNVTLAAARAAAGAERVCSRGLSRTAATPSWAGTATSAAFCRPHGIVYQGFSLLTANRAVAASPAVLDIAARHGGTVTRSSSGSPSTSGMIPLTGTTNAPPCGTTCRSETPDWIRRRS